MRETRKKEHEALEKHNKDREEEREKRKEDLAKEMEAKQQEEYNANKAQYDKIEKDRKEFLKQ